MPNTSELSEAPRKELHVFYVLDTSGSMTGEKIAMLNRTMEECTEVLRNLAKTNGDAILKIAVLKFDSGCEWVTSNGPELLEDFEYEYLDAGGITDMGAALKELNDKLSRHKFLDTMTGALMPIIIFMTDGYPTDDYEKELNNIRQNKWFLRGTKVGFAIGDDADLKMISSVVGNREAVIKTSDLELFRRLMKFVSVTASMLVSKSSTTGEVSSGERIIKLAKEELKLSDDITPDISDDSYNKEPDSNESDDGFGDADW